MYGTCDNAVNAQGVEAERRIGRSIMSGLHGMWSLGVLAGALIGSLAAREHIDPRVQFAVMGAVIAVGGIAATLLVRQHSPRRPPPSVDAPRFVWPRGMILLIGLVGFAAIFVEIAAKRLVSRLHALGAACEPGKGSARDRRVRRVDGGRAAGWRCGNPPDRSQVVRADLRTARARPAACSWPPARARGAALAGFLLIGIGVSVVIPLVFAAAGNSGPSPALGVAGVATISYGAGLAAPSAMGGIADVSSLRVAFAVAALLACAVVGRRRTARAASQPGCTA